MGKFRNLVGEKFGRLIVIKRVEKEENSKYKRVYWLCKCDCGNEKIIAVDLLIKGYTKSCGCLHDEVSRKRLLKEKGYSTKKRVWKKYIRDAERRNILFELTEEETHNIMEKNCYYCGREPKTVLKSEYNNGDYIYNGIDRLNNKIGYILKNCVPCCPVCNHAKYILSEKEFLTWIKSVYEFRDLSNFA